MGRQWSGPATVKGGPPPVTAYSSEPLSERIGALHHEIQAHFPFIVRVAVALYDVQTDDIKTFLSSPRDASPLQHYSTKLADAGWLNDLRTGRRARIIDDFDEVDLGTQLHSVRIRQGDYKASYTVPIFDEEGFRGFVFFNASEPRVFTLRVTRQLDLFVRIIALTLENALHTAGIVVGSVHMLREVSRFRDDETASHLNRMAHFAGLIARAMAEDLGADDEWVEHVALFAPLHDVGKITLPDTLLLKPAALTPEEQTAMRRHPVDGEDILRGLIEKLGLQHTPHIGSLLKITRHHHERWDGTGYPDRLKGTAIPIEARIVAVADVFDALTSDRCYKPAWPLEEAVAYLKAGRGTQFDARCVEAFLAQMPAIEGIVRRFPPESPEIG